MGLAPTAPYDPSRWGLAALATAGFLVLRSSPASGGAPRRLAPFAALTALLVAVPAGFTPYAVAHASGALRWSVGLALAWAVHRKASLARRGIPWILGLGVAEALLILLQVAGLSWPFPAGLTARLGGPGTFSNPNWAAAVLAPLIPLALYRARAGHGGRPGWEPAAAVVMAVGLVATRSRGGMAAAAVGLVGLAVASAWSRFSARQRLAAAGAALAVVGVAGARIGVRPGEIAGMEGRLFLWRSALVMARENPWAGVGLGGFAPAYPGAAAAVLKAHPGAQLPLGAVEVAHGSFLQMAAEAGIPAALGFTGLTGLTALRALAAGAGFPAAVGASLLALSAHAVIDAPLQTAGGFVLYWYLVGLATAGGIRRPPDRDRGRNPGRSWSWVLVLVAGVAAANGVRLVTAALLWQGARTARSAGDLARGRVLSGWGAVAAPEVGPLRSFRAQVLAASGEPVRALEELKAARALSFSFQDMFLYGGLLRQTRGRGPALEYWRDIARLFPQLLRPRFEMGRIYEEMGMHNDAIREYRAVVASPQPTGAAQALRRVARKRLRRLGAAR
ncbi:O-antigen ligase family protein [Deferrisoma camini]|uniref:O-antigen ligase family protein n=1 Tax=Deferrisoma camini TaxID=1035120 RepID=UPI0004AF64E9|nr:O-antigen ligase family protein [Deferrisoma camini]